MLYIIAPLHLCITNYTAIGQLSKYSHSSFKPDAKQKYNCYYIRLDGFPNGSILYFKVTLTYGSFEHGTMYYAPSNQLYFSKIVLPNYVSYYNSNSKLNINNYYFAIVKPNNYQYLYIAPPPASKFQSQSSITVLNQQGPLYFVFGELSKFSYNYFYPRDKGKYGVYCISTEKFPKDSYIYFKTTITNGNFANGIMLYGGSITKLSSGDEVTFSSSVSSSSLSENTYYFSVPKTSGKYLCVCTPPASSYTSQTKVTIYNTYRAHEINYKVSGELSKYSNETFYPNEEGNYRAYYINTDNFPGDTKLFFKMTIESESFEHEYMFYSVKNEESSYGDTINLPSNIFYYSSMSASDTYYFIISKPNSKYLYIAPPPVYNYNNQSRVTVYNIFGSSFKVLGELSKYGHKSFYPNEEGIYCAYYINTDLFPKDNELYFNVTLNYGNFENEYMYYGVSNDSESEGTEITLFDYVSSNSSTNESNIFVIPKTSYKYLYIAPPPLYIYDSQSQVTIYNLYRPYNIDYKVLGELSKYSNEKFNPNEEGKYCAYYINADLFPKDSKLYFKVTLTYGTFEHGNMFYEGSDTKFDNDSTIILSNNVNNDSYSNTSDTYYFIISKPNNSYLYFAPPPVDSYNNFSTITVYNIYGSTNKVLEELSKYGHKSFYPSKKKNQCAYYIRTSNFISESELYFNVTLNYGSFEYGKLFYKGYDNVLGNNKEITFYDYVNSSTNESNMFVVPKTSYKYLYIAPPSLYNYDSQSQVTIYNTYRPYNIEYKVLGELSKFSNKTFNPYEEGKYCAYYLKIDNYKNDKELYFNVILTNGSFEHEHMFYEGSNTEFNNESIIVLTNDVARENYFCERNSIYFIISKLNYKYLYFAPPPPSEFNNQTRFTIHNTKTSNSPESPGTSSSSNKVAIGVGVGGAILAVIVAILSIILHKHKKGVQSTSIDTSIIEPIHLTAK